MRMSPHKVSVPYVMMTMSDQHTILYALSIELIVLWLHKLDLFNDHLLDAQQGAPYPGVAHAVHWFLTLDKPET